MMMVVVIRGGDTWWCVMMVVVMRGLERLTNGALRLFQRKDADLVSPVVSLRRYFSSSSSSSPSSSSVFSHPPPSEVAFLARRFPDPRSRVSLFLFPISRVDPSALPRLTLRPKYGEKCFKCRLSFSWPTAFAATGMAESRSQAEENAFLLACKTLANLGLLLPEEEEEEEGEKKKKRRKEIRRRRYDDVDESDNDDDDDALDDYSFDRGTVDVGGREKRFRRAITRDLYRTAWCWGKRFVVDIRSSLAPSFGGLSGGLSGGISGGLSPTSSRDTTFADGVASFCDRASTYSCSPFSPSPSSSPSSPPPPPPPAVPDVSSLLSSPAGVWRCRLSFDWPAAIRVSSAGRTRFDAERNACVLACVQLRTRNIFDRTLSIPAAVMDKLVAAAASSSSSSTSSSSSRMDGGGGGGGVRGGRKRAASKNVRVSLWTDAGRRGYGAYYHQTSAENIHDGDVNAGKNLNDAETIDSRYANGIVEAVCGGNRDRVDDGVVDFGADDNDNNNNNNNNNVSPSPPDNRRTWLTQPWPPFILDSFLADHTSFLEFYAAVSAVYTWRRTFRDERVTLHTDSECVADFVNKGIPDWVYLDANHGRWEGNVTGKNRRLCKRTNASFDRLVDDDDDDDEEEDEGDFRHHAYFYVAHLHSLLMKTKYNMNVDLRAVCVPREENRMADALAKGDADAFRRLSRESGGGVGGGGGRGISSLPKKAKQLAFLPVFRLFPFLPTAV